MKKKKGVENGADVLGKKKLSKGEQQGQNLNQETAETCQRKFYEEKNISDLETARGPGRCRGQS